MSGRYSLWTDGGSRGNPGPAAIAFVLRDPAGDTVAEDGRPLGETTNNVAEYEALLWGLEAAASQGVEALDVRVDSELVARQLSGEYRVKDAKLVPLHARALQLLGSFAERDVRHVPREENARADALVNEVLDERTGRGRSGTPGSYELTVKGHFDAAHELRGYPGECRDLHGHTWDVEVTVRGTELDRVGIVYDFKRLKEDLASVLGPFDHAHLNEVPPFDEVNPTGENLARVIHDRLGETVDPRVRVVEVVVWESPVAKLVYRPAGA